MTSTSSRRLLVGAFALIASAGTGAAVHAVGAPRASDQQATTASATAPAGTAAQTLVRVPASTARPLTAAQATLIAERQGHGRATEVDAETEVSGKTYEVKVLRPGGVEAKIVVDAASGRVLSSETDSDVEDQADAPDDSGDTTAESGSVGHDH